MQATFFKTFFTFYTLPKTCRNTFILTVLVLILTSQIAIADLDNLQELSISAETAEIDEPGGWAMYSGDVQLTQGTLSIQCDSLKIYRSADGIDKVIARGRPALYSQEMPAPTDESEGQFQGSLEAKAQQITYQLETNSIELKGNAKIQQGENLFEGHTITYQIDDRKIIAKSDVSEKSADEPKQRVKITLPVRNTTSQKDE